MKENSAALDQTLEHQLDVSLVSDLSGRTYIGGQFVAYPYHLCRALRTLGDPEGMPTLYIQSCSGGLFEGENLRARLRVGSRARAHVTTAASTIVHSMQGGEALQRIEIDATAGGFLEYMPDPMILFPQAVLRNTTVIRASKEATVMACDSFLAHDPKASGGVFAEYASELSICDEHGKLLTRDRYRVEGSVFSRHTPGVMAHHRTQAGFVLVRRQRPVTEWMDRLRQAVAMHKSAYLGLSTLPNDAGLWARVLAPDAACMREVLASLWACARELITGAVPVPRRK